MSQVVSQSASPAAPASPRRALHRAWGRPPVRVGLTLVVIAAAALLSLQTSAGASRTTAFWPVSALATGLLLVSPRRLHAVVLGSLLPILVAARLVSDTPLPTSVGFSLAAVAEVWVVAHLLTRGRTSRPTLLAEGDVSRMIGSVAAGAGVASLGHALTCALTSQGSPVLAAASVFGTHAAGSLVLLPLFLRTPRFPALAGTGERVLQTAILLGTTVAVFAVEPPVFFAVIPMFSWLAFRGTLRQSTVLIAVVAAVALAMTLAGVGPIAALDHRFDLAPELVNGVLQLFLIDAAIILLPLTAMMTQQRMDAAELARRRQTLERIVSSATQTAIVTTDLEGRVQLFNPGAEMMLGYEAEVATGRAMDLFIPTDELVLRGQELGTEPAFAPVAAALVQDGPAQRLWRFARSDGATRTLQMTLSPIEDEEGAPAGYLATAEDVTEREAARTALLDTLENQQRAVDSLRELDQVKSDFVATVSHELRTPIASIMGYVEVLQDGLVGALSPEQVEVVDRVDRNGRRLQTLIEDLLLVSHIERHGLVLRPADVDLRDVVHAARAETESLLPGRQLEVEVDLPDEPVPHHVDAERLQRVVANLLGNAVKFTPDGGRIWVRLDRGEDATGIVVGDTGVGIPEEEQARMTSRFFRASTSMTQAVQGAGLGLTLVRAILAQHGGELRVTSARGCGTVITAVVPHRIVAAPASRRTPDAAAAEPV